MDAVAICIVTLHFRRHLYFPSRSTNVSTNFGDDRSNSKEMAAVFLK